MHDERDSEDLIATALRRAYRVRDRMDERFEDLLRRLADQDSRTAEKR